MKILIVEDDSPSRLALCKALLPLDFEIVAFADVGEAWAYLKINEVQVVIIDWSISGLDGPDLCHKIRLLAVLKAYVYVVVLAAEPSREDRLKALQAGADDIMARPIDHAELVARIEVARRIIDREEALRNRSDELERLHAELERRNLLLAEIASCDGLTGLKNHRYFRESLEAQFSLARWRGASLSVLMIDVDQFKSFNDSFGHLAGDDVLREVARILRSCVRDHDVVARYGGEEFAVFLPSTDVDDSRSFGERLRAAIEQSHWVLRPITISLGISTSSPRVARAATLIDQADRSLYQSKAEGRNRVTHARDLTAAVADRRVSHFSIEQPTESDREGLAIPFIA